MRSLKTLVSFALAFTTMHCTLVTCGVGAETAKPRNQVLIAGIGDPGALTVFEYRDGKYESIWSTVSSDVAWSGGAKIGDFNNDGVNEFLLTRRLKSAQVTDWETVLEAWGYDRSTGGWERVFRRSFGIDANETKVGAIGDFDRDGLTEIFLTNSLEGAFEIWGNKQKGARTMEKLATVHKCAVDHNPETGNQRAWFIKTAADLNGNGTPEIVTHCLDTKFDFGDAPRSRIVMYEFRNGSYVAVGSVASPIHIIDDSDSGDLNQDGRSEIVLCGTSSTSHVLAFRDGAYRIDYTAPLIVVEGIRRPLTQACSVGDLTNDGKPDWADLGGGLVRVFTHQEDGYAQIWQGSWPANLRGGGLTYIGASAIGDSDNDGKMELLHSVPDLYPIPFGVPVPGSVRVWKAEGAKATTFVNTHTFPGEASAVAVGALK